MKVFAKATTTNQYGLELVITDDNNVTTAIAPDKIATDGLAYHFPANPAGREWLFVKKWNEKAVNGVLELKPHVERSLNPSPKTPTKPLLEYLTEDEKKVYDELIAKAKARKDAQSSEAKLRADYEKALALVESLRAQMGGNK